jgi:hypothetical protein
MARLCENAQRYLKTVFLQDRWFGNLANQTLWLTAATR